MPSPIAHSATGFVISRIATRMGTPTLSSVNPHAVILVAVGLSLLPDLDSVLGLLLGDFGRYHNNASHSLFVGLAIAVVVGLLAVSSGRAGFLQGFFVALACFQLHVIMDFFTVGRGVMAFWPLTAQRFSSPLPLFYGLRWSDGWFSQRHLWTVLTEVPFAVAIAFAACRLWPIGRASEG